jgi:hypothetical protein
MSSKTHIHSTPVAKSVPFDNSTNGFVSTNTQNAIEEVFQNVALSASPGFSFGRSGTTTAGTYLLNETVPSNISGRWVYINNAVVVKAFVANELVATYSIEVLYHDGNGAGLTSIGTVTVTAAKGGSFTVNWPVPTDKQVAVRMTAGSASSKNIVVGLQLSGTT